MTNAVTTHSDNTKRALQASTFIGDNSPSFCACGDNGASMTAATGQRNNTMFLDETSTRQAVMHSKTLCCTVLNSTH